jgi:thiol-disulfide isomerase/thioredoxin
MKFWKKYNNYLFFAVLLIVLLVPQIRFPVQVFLQRLLSFSPSEIAVDNRETIHDFNWTLVHVDETVLNFNELKGDIIVVNFWATWCPPCVAEMPDFQDLYNDYHDKVQFLFVSNDPLSKVKSFADINDLSLPFYMPASAEPKVLNYSTLPTTFIIDKNQQIVMRKEGAAKWNSSKVRELLDELE